MSHVSATVAFQREQMQVPVPVVRERRQICDAVLMANAKLGENACPPQQRGVQHSASLASASAQSGEHGKEMMESKVRALEKRREARKTVMQDLVLRLGK